MSLNKKQFELSDDLTDELELREGDYWMRAEGDSMETDKVDLGFLVMLRPLKTRRPRRGEIVHVQFYDPQGNVIATALKYLSEYDPLRLNDGRGNDFELPNADYAVVGILRGVIGPVR